MAASFELFTIDSGVAQQWTARPDFDASGPADLHFLLDATSGTVTFGDGDKGQVVPKCAIIAAKYLATRADAGNLAAGVILKICDSSVQVTNGTAATGGSAAETLSQAEARAAGRINSPARAVTLADYESFALGTPGVSLARVKAWANMHPAFPCLTAPGVIAVCVIPFLPARRPAPSAGLLRAVARYLRRKRILGTRIEVCGPSYVEIAVRARVQASPGVSATALSQSVVSILNEFFDPLLGGPEGTGWPLGQDVYQSDVLGAVSEADGIDHVASLELLPADGTSQGNSVGVGPMGLPASGQHQIQVVS